MQKLKCDLELLEVVGHLIIWLVLTCVTIGLALFVMPYYLAKLPINRCYIVDGSGQPIGRLFVDFNLANMIGHILIWVLITLLTVGLAYPLYWFAVIRKLYNSAQIVPVQSLLQSMG